MTTETLNKFELMAFEAAVKEHLACETSALALVDYLMEYGFMEMQARLHVMQLRRAECERLHYRECIRRSIHEYGFRDRARVHVAHALGRRNLANRPWYFIRGATPPLVEYQPGWRINADGGLQSLSYDEAARSMEDGRQLVTVAVFVGATWVVRRMRLGLPDIG